MEEAIRLIKNIIDYNSCEKWGRALQYAVKVLEEHYDKEKASEERNKKTNSKSIPTKIANLKVNEQMVLFPKDYKTFMRTLVSHKSRGEVPLINYHKVQVIFKDTLLVGVLIKKLEE